jgi:predicted anti-sigma-YlaC factor YlaD
MSGSGNGLAGPCIEAREIIHEMLDGPIPAERAAALETHLDACDACRDFQAELLLVQRGLRDLSEIPMPDDALEEVWVRTVRAEGRGVAISAWKKRWRHLAAAAALVLVATFAVWKLQPDQPAGPTEEEVAIARAQLEQVLGLTGSAIQRTQRAAGQVIQDKVSPSLQRIPILGSKTKEDETRSEESWNG